MALNLIEADIKVRYNYSGFIPAFIGISDKEGKNYAIQTVAPLEGKWFTKRNVHIHSTFKR